MDDENLLLRIAANLGRQLSSQQQQQEKEQQRQNNGKNPKRSRHPSAFIALILAGVTFRAVALATTAFAVRGGLAIEGNPVFYMLSTPDFVVMTFVTLVILYGLFWVVPMSAGLRLSLALLVTLISGFDMVHDIFLINYHEDVIKYLMQHLPI